MNPPLLQVRTVREIESRNAQLDPPLMERAGTAAAEIARRLLAATPLPPLVIAGPGNNGGDAFVVARLLKAAGHAPRVLFADDPERLPPDARAAHAAWLAAGGDTEATYPDGDFGLIVDGLFGIGLSRLIEGRPAQWIERINASRDPVLALDVPSGLDADTGVAHGAAVRATHTATFIAMKPGLFTADGPDHCGEISLCDLGIGGEGRDGELIAPSLFRACLRPRRRNSHKGSFGAAAIIGGAAGMAGAALLAGRAALKLGAGRVYVGMLERLPLDPVQPELMLREAATVFELATVLAIGPGLGQSVQAGELLVRALDSELPLAIDADGLNLLSVGTLLMRKIAVRPAPTLLTPHPAEAARLLERTTAEVQGDRIAAARELAQRFKSFVALKGCGTVVAAPDGRWFVNATGNAGLAAAGSGDVLTGILAALLAQHWPPLDALLAAVHLHGAAADVRVAEGAGPIGLAAGEIVEPARALLNGWIAHLDD